MPSNDAKKTLGHCDPTLRFLYFSTKIDKNWNTLKNGQPKIFFPKSTPKYASNDGWVNLIG